MKAFFCFRISVLLIVLLSVASQESASQYPQPSQGTAQAPAASRTSPAGPGLQNEQEAKIQASLAKLSREDAQLAAAQGFCPILVNNRLGSMGPPIKIVLKNQPVFVCCENCRKKAIANPDATLANVSAAKAKTAEAEITASLAKLTPEDRRLAAAQGFCPVMTDNRLGVMGTPVKIMVKDQPVFLCCAGCRTKALADPDRTLAMVANLKAKVADAAARKSAVEANSTRR